MVEYRGASEAMRNALARVSPGTPLRDGIDRIVHAQAGALLVMSDDPEVLEICSGGFLVDAPFSPQRLSELAKMDGAIIISTDGGRIKRANVHLVPDPTVPTNETGTRHRTAERVARSLDVPVVTASEEMGVINVYAAGGRRQLQEVGRLLDRANQAVQTLERYKQRLDDAMSRLNALEIEDVVTLRNVVTVMQRGEMVHRIGDEIETMIVELGIDARLIRLQVDEINVEVDDEFEYVIADYLPPHRNVEDTLAEMSQLRDDDVSDARQMLKTLHLGDATLDDSIQPQGLRMLHRVKGLPEEVAEKIAGGFDGLARLQRATVDDLTEVEGVDENLASNVKESLERATESAILEQYH